MLELKNTTWRVWVWLRTCKEKYFMMGWAKKSVLGFANSANKMVQHSFCHLTNYIYHSKGGENET